MIREAVIRDVPQIRALSDELWGDSNLVGLERDDDNMDDIIANLILSEHSVFYVATKDEKIVGFIIVIKEQSYTKKPMAHLYMIYVRKANRRSDIGAALLEESIKKVNEWNACAYFVGVASGLETDTKLINMYTKYDFVKVGTYYRRIM